MLPTFVIGLREGLEAALIVGIIAAFLRKQGRTDLLRWALVGVGIAVGLCVAVGVVLEVLSRDLPQRQQEGLETVVGALAVAMVTYMVVWMRRHARSLKTTLEGAAASALADQSAAGRALVVMAFLAVLREGFETVVFLIAAFNETGNGSGPIAGALTGIAVAIVLAWGIYRGGVRLNLSKFFRVTGLVLVLVAAGLVVTALHTAHEAGWLNTGQTPTVDLTWLVRPDSVQASLLTGMLGVQAHPVVAEVIGWLAYLLPVGAYVVWPPGRSVSVRRAAQFGAAISAATGAAALVLATTMPAAPPVRPVTASDTGRVQLVASSGADATLRMSLTAATRSAAVVETTTTTTAGVAVHRSASTTRDGLALVRYTGSVTDPATSHGPTTRLTPAAIARLNDGRLPLGVTVSNGRLPVTYRTTTLTTALIEPRTQRVVSATQRLMTTAVLHAAVGSIPLADPVRVIATATSPTTTAAAVSAANRDLSRLDDRSSQRTLAVTLGAIAVLALLTVGGCAVVSRRKSRTSPGATSNLRGHRVGFT